MIGLWATQVLAVVRLEMRKTFLARRGLWVYVLAFAPVVLFAAHAIMVPRERNRLAQLAAEHPVSTLALNAVQVGAGCEEVLAKLGRPYQDWTRHHRTEKGQRNERRVMRYTDGLSDVTLVFSNGKLDHLMRHNPETLPQNSLLFAALFQSYYLRLAVFFGCVGIFMNLFRGEMLDKSIHFYLLTPMRREVLLAGKYLAGLLAAVVIFTSSTAMQWLAMLWPFDRAATADFLAGPGGSQFASYLGITALACVAYGSVFLAVGLLFSNPVIPTGVVLLWESVNPFLPPALKKISMLFYLQSLCPAAFTPDKDLPPMLFLLISPTQPARPATAVACIAILTALVLLISARAARKIQINYSAD